MIENKKNDFEIPIIRGYQDGIYYLRNLYNKIFNILDTVIFSDHIIPNKALNIFYTGLLGSVENIIKQKEYRIFKKYFPDHPDNLLNLSDEIRVWWEEELRSQALNFIAQIEKANLKIGDYKNPTASFNKVMTGIDTAINHHIEIDKKLSQKDNENLEKLKDVDKFIHYDYKGNLGILNIKHNSPIEFKGTVSRVLNFFYNYSELDNKYKYYREFDEFDEGNIKSAQFSDKIEAINKRVKKETNGKIKSIITMAKKEKPTQTNKYKWEVKT